MNRNPIRRNLTPTGDLLCAELESWLNWRAQSRLVTDAYRAWSGADADERWLAFAQYLNALDAEERAAATYQRTLELVDQ